MALSEQTRDPFATLAPWVEHVKESATLAVSSQAAKMRAQGIDVISLNAGEPDFDTPEHVKQAAIDALHQGKTRYTVVDGLVELRQAICDKLLRDQKVQYAPNEILVSTGAKQSLYNFFMAFVRPGDEVIVPAPFWVSYPPQIELAGGKPVIVTATQAQDFKITPQQLEAAITPRTRALVLNSPSNPTGSVYSLAELQAIAAVAERHRIVIISDEIYEKLRFDGHTSGPTPAAFSPELRNLTVVVNGFSKAYAMTGWRIGYAAGPRAIIEAMTTLQSQSTSNCTTPTQYAALAALRGSEDFLAPMVAEYKKRRDFVVSRLNRISGLSSNIPQGAFYVMANVTGLYGKGDMKTDLDVASFFLNKAHVATVPGEPFGAPGYLRLSFATSMEALDKSLHRIEEAIKTLSIKTNAVRLLETRGVPFELRMYDVDMSDLSAPTVARKIGLPPEQVFKTLLARGDRHGPCFAVVPADAELDPKALARASGDRKIELVALREVQPLSGYIRGAVTVLGARKDYPVYLDDSAMGCEVISISAGTRGLQILIAPALYRDAVGATLAAIARKTA